MMEWYQAIVLAVVQGLTEFLPISTSAHLAISPILLGWPDQGLAFDIAVHVGTLSAVIFYYRKDLKAMALSWFASLAGGKSDSDSRLVWYLAIATVPVGIVGVTAGDFIGSHLRNLSVIATTTLVFGLLLGLADKRARSQTSNVAISLSLALLIGLAQALAPIPGVSRSGVTITAALLLGLDRQFAARFSFLLSIPVIASAGCSLLLDLAQSHQQPIAWMQLIVALALSGLTAYFCIGVFIRLLDRVGLMPFVYYRIGLAAVLYYFLLA
jgi:undecaprenyl-diphosphatase